MQTSPNVTQTTDDHTLLQRIARDNDDALRIFYQRYARVIFALAYRILGDATRAEDITQETFLRVWRMAGSFDPERGRAEAWLITIARNVAISELRRNQTQPVTVSADEEIGYPDQSDGPEEIAWLRARQRGVREALDLLPAAQRQVILLSYFEGLSQSEIAARTGEPLGTVKSRLRLALQRLGPLLRDKFGDIALASGICALLDSTFTHTLR